MNAIDFVVRSPAGDLAQGVVEPTLEPTLVSLSAGEEVSLNLSEFDVTQYRRVGEDLQILLADGRIVVLQNYFGDAAARSQLYLSSNSSLQEVAFVEGENGALYAQYTPSSEWGKWSPNDALIHVERPDVVAGEYGENEVSMLAAPLLGGLGGGGLAAGAAAGALLLGAGRGDDGSNSSNGPRPPADPTVMDGDIIIGGDDADQSLTVTGTGEPGAEVLVTVGGLAVPAVIDEDGRWSARFEGDTFPAEGQHGTEVVVTTEGKDETLQGPDVTIDLTGPDIEVTDGTVEVGDIINGAEQASGTVISGLGEAGTDMSVTIGDTTLVAPVGEDGTWTVTFGPDAVVPGEYETGVTLRSEDAYGNSSSLTQTVQVDTIAEVTITSGLSTDGTVFNAADLAQGHVLTGTTQTGSAVEVTLNGVTRAADVAQDGTWSVSFPASEVPSGTLAADVSVLATDAVGNTAATGGAMQIDTETAVTMDTASDAADGVVNASERADGVDVTGTAEAGATVVLAVDGETFETIATATGAWSVTIPATALPEGESQVFLQVTATDMAGNTASTSGTFALDTQVEPLTLTSATGGADGVINAAEAAQDLVLSGQVEAGSTLLVGFGDQTYAASVSADGSWSVTIPAADVPGGDAQSHAVTLSATDAAGNTRTETGQVQIDTEVAGFAVNSVSLGSDDVLNKAEVDAGVVVTGTTEPGATALVSFGDVTHAATVAADGTWSVTFAPGEIPYGEYDTQVSVVSTDAAGNTATASQSVKVDTLVNALNMDPASATADGIVSSAELAANGLMLSGQVEPGSALEVVLGGQGYTAQVAASGAWTLTIPGNAVPPGEYAAQVELNATDAAGNTRAESGSLNIDTEAPEGPEVTFVLEAPTGVAGVFTESQADADQTVFEVGDDGAISALSSALVADNGVGDTIYTFQSTVPDGSDLVIAASDAAGNTRGTYLVLEDGAAGSAVDMATPGLGTMNVDAIQLEFAEDADLTLTEADILALSSETNTVTVTGGSDDQITLAGASRGETMTEQGQSFVSYTLGEATVLIDSDITNVVT